MGLISLVKDVVDGGLNALAGTANSVIWKEYFESGDMSNGILMKRGEKILTEKGKNRKADDNLISSGSGIDVQEGQCMILVENGKIVEFCAEPGRYTYDASIQPSLYAGENKGLKALGKEILAQWSAGGQRFSTQRVYFINLGELIYTPIKWGCGDIAFHHTQIYKATNSLLELDMTLRANGQCTLQVTDPVKFFKVIGAQKTGTDNDAVIKITDDGILSNLKSGVIDHISSAISTLGYEQQVPYTAIKAKSKDIKEYLNSEIEKEWAGNRGFSIANISFNGSPVPSEENKQQLEEMQNSFNMSQNLNAANYDIQKTMARGFESAGENGGANGMFGMGIAMGTAGMSSFGNLQNQNPVGHTSTNQVPSNVAVTSNEETWTCTCNSTNTTPFCSNCGSKKPEPNNKPTDTQVSWVCSCGKVNGIMAKFCPECGTKKPVVKKMVCDKCGWTPNPNETVHFCPLCGDIFDDADIVES
jgi:membrane protease subunit (stomatin/prohibitin family)